MNTLIDFFNSYATRGETVAMEWRAFRTFKFTYTELDRLSRRAARFLGDQGIRKGDRVVIWAPNSPWWVIAYFGILLRGGVVVPVDFASDNERARWIAEQSKASLAFASRYKAGVKLGVPTFLIEDLEQTVEAERRGTARVVPEADPPPAENDAEVEPDDIAVLIFTSGTTGDPKGVPLTHANLVANLKAIQAHIEIVPSDVFLSVLPLSHMFEMMPGCLTPLSVGARVVYLRTVKPSALFDALSAGTITVFIAVPRLLSLLKGSIEQKFDHLRLGGLLRGLRNIARAISPAVRRKVFWFIHKKIGSRFRYFVSGGAALDMGTAQFWDDLGFTLIEGYGLTECAPVLTANQPGKVRLGTVGSPIPGVEIRIAADGEIEARGANIFSGYADNPQATEEAFTEDGWFKTGDAGMMREGLLSIHSRKKDVIVTAAGVNVYPEDVEAVLGQVSGVRECAVMGLNRGQGETVHAVLALERDAQPAQVVTEANKHLDRLQHITDWTLWEGELPKTTTLKVKKNEIKRIVGAAGHSPVRAGLAEKSGVVKQIIGAVVGKNPDAIRDEDYLSADLHLTSLDRADLLSRLEQEFRLDLPEDAIGRDTTVATLTRIVREKKRFRARHHMRAWAFRRGMNALRGWLFWLVVRPCMRSIGRPRAQGAACVTSLQGPFILASNHVSYFDQPMTLSVLPRSVAGRVATAAREDFFYDSSFRAGRRLWGRFCFDFCTFFLGTFLLPQGRQVSESMRFMGSLADRQCPIFIYPEGERSRDGTLLPFQPGLARMALELKLPVVPVRVRGMGKILPRGSGRIRRGHAAITFGKPLRFPPNATTEKILEETRNAILAL